MGRDALIGRDSTAKCVVCGRFMSYKDFEEGHFHFIPLNEFGPEENEWTHKKCLDECGEGSMKSEIIEARLALANWTKYHPHPDDYDEIFYQGQKVAIVLKKILDKLEKE